MDFFARQDQARALTRRLAWLFALSVLAIVVLLNLVAWVSLEASLEGKRPAYDVAWLRVQVHGVVTLGTLALIAIGSLWKTAELRAGGPAVAAMLGARPVDRNARDAGERRLINVVEEMSLASGVPMPQVHLLEDGGINAFAAGFGTNDAVVAVTRGCLDRLSRDELQGVVAHEFSHILNGDMRLNLRLIGLVHGILVIALVGRFLLRIAASGRSGGSRSRNNGGVVAIALAGLAMLAIGSIGYFFGQLIKAAIGRQREFLADAAAVQFTRNPDGIGGALKKIGAGYGLSFVKSDRANEASHLFLGRAVAASWLGALDTHPPLDQRIRAIDPRWDGTWPPSGPGHRRDLEPALPRTPVHGAATVAAGLAPVALTQRVGALTPEHVAFGAALIASLPPTLVEAARDPFAARAVVLAVLLGADAVRTLPLLDLLERIDAPLCREVRRLQPAVAALGDGGRLPLIDLATPTFNQCTPGQRRDFRAALELLARSSASIPLPILVLATLVHRRLEEKPNRSGGIYALPPLLPHLSVLLSALAHAGERDEAASAQAFAAGEQHLGVQPGSLAYHPTSAIDATTLFRALDQLAQASPGLARRVVDACAWCVAADGTVTIREAELLRTVCVCLGCPMPPFGDATVGRRTGI